MKASEIVRLLEDSIINVEGLALVGGDGTAITVDHITNPLGFELKLRSGRTLEQNRVTAEVYAALAGWLKEHEPPPEPAPSASEPVQPEAVSTEPVAVQQPIRAPSVRPVYGTPYVQALTVPADADTMTIRERMGNNRTVRALSKTLGILTVGDLLHNIQTQDREWARKSGLVNSWSCYGVGPTGRQQLKMMLRRIGYEYNDWADLPMWDRCDPENMKEPVAFYSGREGS